MLVLTPFVLGWADDSTAVSLFVLLGVAHAALSLMKRFPQRAAVHDACAARSRSS